MLGRNLGRLPLPLVRCHVYVYWVGSHTSSEPGSVRELDVFGIDAQWKLGSVGWGEKSKAAKDGSKQSCSTTNPKTTMYYCHDGFIDSPRLLSRGSGVRQRA
jgi:hypothetical protein